MEITIQGGTAEQRGDALELIEMFLGPGDEECRGEGDDEIVRFGRCLGPVPHPTRKDFLPLPEATWNEIRIARVSVRSG